MVLDNFPQIQNAYFFLHGLAIRNANQGDSRESIRRKTPIFITCERFARIASNLRVAIFNPLKRDSQKRGSVRGPSNDLRESGIHANLRIDSLESSHLNIILIVSFRRL